MRRTFHCHAAFNTATTATPKIDLNAIFDASKKSQYVTCLTASFAYGHLSDHMALVEQADLQARPIDQKIFCWLAALCLLSPSRKSWKATATKRKS